MTGSRVMKKAGAGLVGIVLATTLMVAPAFAETADTSVTLRVNPDSMIDFTAPTVIPGLINSDGTIEYADSDAEFKNDSMFGIAISNVKVENGIGSVVKASVFAGTSEANAITTTLDLAGTTLDLGEAIGASGKDSTSGQFGFGPGDTHGVSLSGSQAAIKNIDSAFNTATNVFDINWTVKAGSNA